MSAFILRHPYITLFMFGAVCTTIVDVVDIIANRNKKTINVAVVKDNKTGDIKNEEPEEVESVEE